MRADRLVAIVLLLQTHGRMTAPELAERLEVSVRTVRRDLDALCVAGVPLYAQRGRSGGWTLLGGSRIDLSGLTAAEAEALFTVTAPGNVAGMGAGGTAVGAGLDAALRKVLAAMPEPLRARVDAARRTILVDAAGWGRPPVEAPACLDALRAAVLAGEQIDLCYAPPGRPAEDRRLHPHGLVCNRGIWYLVATAPRGMRTYRLSRVVSVRRTGLPADRPDGFDLATAWAAVGERLRERATAITVEVSVTPQAADFVRASLARWCRVEPGAGPGQLLVAMPSVPAAARELAAFGDDVVVHGPAEVRAELARTGAKLVERYGTPTVVG